MMRKTLLFMQQRHQSVSLTHQSSWYMYNGNASTTALRSAPPSTTLQNERHTVEGVHNLPLPLSFVFGDFIYKA